MARGPNTFRQRDVMRAIKAATAAGFTVAKVEISREGTITVVLADELTHDFADTAQEANPWHKV